MHRVVPFGGDPVSVRAPPSPRAVIASPAVRRFARACGVVLVVVPVALAAQRPSHGPGHDVMRSAAPARRDSLSAMASLVGTTTAPGRFGERLSELLLTQPMLMARGARGDSARLRFEYAGMLNLERWTMPGGELTPAIWGEGFVERRHPHTVVHELVATLRRDTRAGALSLAAGKGIVPFGSDDPMVRPFVKYAANHHLAQLLERVVFVAAWRPVRTVALEAATFNGDEAVAPLAAPRWSRVGDSFAGRATLWPWRGLELSASGARVASPEFADGLGLDQRKVHVGVRWAEPAAGRYALVEWARTEDLDGDRVAVRYRSALAEAAWRVRGVVTALRLERTTRPEEERLLDPFRVARPHTDFTVKGLTRWDLVTGQLARPLALPGGVHAVATLEATWARSSPRLVPVLLDPADVIGGRRAWYVTASLRVGAGAMPARVGRYGVARGPVATDLPLAMWHGGH